MKLPTWMQCSFRRLQASLVPFLILILFIPAQPARAAVNVIRVTPEGLKTEDCGLNWDTACDLQYALQVRANTDDGETWEIWVKTGTYYPTTQASNREASFQLHKGVALYGGFAGSETERDDRSWINYPSVLSGDIDRLVPTTGNSYHVVFASKVDETAILDGFTITGGQADCNKTPCNLGGGLYNEGSDWSLDGDPGQVVLDDVGYPGRLTIANIILENNDAVYGGGMYNYVGSPTLTHVIFRNNHATYGGGMDNHRTGYPQLTDVTFFNNGAIYGGAMVNTNNAAPVLTNVTISHNTATSGAGIYNSENALHTGAILTHVTLSNNVASYMGGAIFNDNSASTVRNSILWNNQPNEIYNKNSSPTVSYSDIQGGYSGVGNIDGDPLLGLLGNYGGQTQAYPLLLGSPAIDAVPSDQCTLYYPVSPLLIDQRNVARPQSTGCDMGAYEIKTTHATSNVIRVTPEGLQTADCGLDWSTACDLQYALQERAITDAGETWEIWVKTGTYYPTIQSNDREAYFQLHSGVALYGGFAGLELKREDRNWVSHTTVLSGDIDRLELETGNSYHVVFASQVDETAVLDGFTITAGQADCGSGVCPGGGVKHNGAGEWALAMGGGVYNTSGSPTIANVIFENNEAVYGGGMYNHMGSPTLTHVVFQNNNATYGGGIDNYKTGYMQLSDVTFYNNSATFGGGMLNSDMVAPVLNNVTFSGNTADIGAGIYNYYCRPEVSAILTHVTLSDNVASYTGGGIYNDVSAPTVRNSILWNNLPEEISTEDIHSFVTMTYSDIEGGYPGTGNLNVDPLLGVLNIYGGFTQILPLLPGSSVIDKGDAAVCASIDQRGVVRPQGTGCDMGAYEARPFSLNLVSVNQQSASITAPFANPLEIQVTGVGNDPVDGGLITFAAPSSGPGALLNSSTAVIVNGRANVMAVANETVGEYYVDVSAAGSSGARLSLVNLPVPTNIEMVSSLTPSLIGQSIDLIATVRSQPPVTLKPLGLVRFYDGETLLGSATLDDKGVASYKTSSLLSGTHLITAIYEGQTSFHGSGPASFSQEVRLQAANLTLGNLRQTYDGTSKTVLVTTDPPGLPVQVTYNGSMQLPINAGSYQVVARISDPLYVGSVSGELIIDPVTLTVTADSLSRAYGQDNPPWTYSVTGLVNGETVSVVSGKPLLTSPADIASDVGSYPINVDVDRLSAENYRFMAKTGTLTIHQATPAISVQAPVLPIRVGQTVRFQVTVIPPTSGTPTGYLTYKFGSLSPQTVELVDGQAVITESALGVGLYSVTVVYEGDKNFADSTVDSVTLSVAGESVYLPILIR